MADIFISWGSPDGSAVRQLCGRLRANGLDFFEYSEEMKAGDQISPRVNGEINAARMAIFCISDETLKRPWITTEMNWCHKSLLDRASARSPSTLEIVPVQVGQRTGALPDLLSQRFTFDLSGPAEFESNLERLVAEIRTKLNLAAPVVVPATVLSFTADQFKNLTEAGKKKLEPLCRKVGMESAQLEKILAGRYGASRLDFSPFPGGRLATQIDAALQVANQTRRRNHRAPVWLWWCAEELFSPDEAVRKFARNRWFSRPSLLVMDSLSLCIKATEMVNPAAGPDLLNECLVLTSFANLANTALLWVPPYTGHTASLEGIIEESLKSLDPLDRIFSGWQNVDAAPYVAFDIGTHATLCRWLYGAFEDLEFEEPQPLDDNVAAMRRTFPGDVRPAGFFKRVLGASTP